MIKLKLIEVLKIMARKKETYCKVGPMTEENKYTFKGLKRNTKYKFAVSAYKTVGNKIFLADTYAYIITRTKK